VRLSDVAGKTAPSKSKSNEDGDLPEGADELKVECGRLIEENTVLKRCLKLMRDNSCLETASLLSAVVVFCDGKFRRQFAGKVTL
jgi:hypothetical protein